MPKQTNRPNIIVIMTDQQRADVSAREGFPLDTTPFLDSLARKGVWFDKAYTASPICVAARCSMLTGRYPGAHRVRENGGIRHVSYTHDVFDVMKEQGYATALIGKNHTYLKANSPSVDRFVALNHFGDQGPFRSEQEKSFTEWLSRRSQCCMEPAPFPADCQNPARGVTSALEWVESLDEEPFFLWLSFPEPHNPYQAPEPYFSMFPPDTLPPVRATAEDRERKGFKWQWCRQQGDYFNPDYEAEIPRVRANYFGMLRLIDDEVQRLVHTLEASGRLDNTILVYLSDHGDFVGEYGLIKKGPELPDILLRIPLFFAGPGIVSQEQPHPAHVSIVDLLPTLCEAIGADIPAGVQGRSLWPLLTGKEYPAQEFASVYGEHGFGGLEFTDEDGLDISHFGSSSEKDGERIVRFDELNTVTQSGFMRTVRKEDWKLNMSMRGKRELYRISDDPLELNNRAGQSETLETELDLLSELAVWMMRSEDPLPYPAGYSYKKDPRNYAAPYRCE
ncbi:Arylsulfatase [Paenibacillus solanacearum]|uniref:Arylsulfatase n=1 Tax=Paenibacillus solanacearum TaxID=2048548 RepID=A0A916K357_9BACL|nr:sulfatase-like hydrolase/transferase [Paenibacillus solanacearum]CAG7636860.1 Arylsulfatase [Paenibacillus solanacearum]